MSMLCAIEESFTVSSRANDNNGHNILETHSAILCQVDDGKREKNELQSM